MLTHGRRVSVFISHATPEDNSFALWLGAKLGAMGYDVWADVMRLRGGDDWAAKLEHALRHRSMKVLFVGTPAGATKRGVRNEIQIATETARKIGDDQFIIPLRLAPFEAPFLVAHAQYIDFCSGWAPALKELVETLDAYGVPKSAPSDNPTWLQLQMINGRPVMEKPERLISNWLAISDLPAKLRYYDFLGSVNHNVASTKIREAPLPAVPFQRGFLSFAEQGDLDEHFSDYELKIVDECTTEALLESGWQRRGLEPWEASRALVDLWRQSIEMFMASRGLTSTRMGTGQLSWWVPRQCGPLKQVSFGWSGIAGSRLIQGFSEKRQVYWHYGASFLVERKPSPHISLIGRLIFSKDGTGALDDAKKAHRLRRSFAKAWRNARWRDMMLAFLYWLAEGKPELLIPVSSRQALTVTLPPMAFQSPLSVRDGESESDDDDPVDDEWESPNAEWFADDVEGDEPNE